MAYLKSFHPYEMRFSGILLPRRSYKRSMLVAGRRNIVPLSDAQVAVLKQNRTFAALLAKGEDGGYVMMSDIPEHLRTPEERLNAEREKTAKLEAELAALRGKTVVTPPAPTAWEVAARKRLGATSNQNLAIAAAKAGVAIEGLGRKELIDAIVAKGPPKIPVAVPTGSTAP